MKTQLVIDNQGNIPFIQAGLSGSTHDAYSSDYNGAHRTGTKPQHPTKCAAIILADQGYPDDGPLLTPA